MNTGAKASLALLFTSIIGLALLIPLPGVNNQTTIKVLGENYNVTLLNISTLPEGDYWGSYDIMTKEIRLATRWLPTYQFISTCSHEVQHLEYELNHPELTTAEEHEKMSGLRSRMIPWNWETECLSLLPERFNL